MGWWQEEPGLGAGLLDDLELSWEAARGLRGWWLCLWATLGLSPCCPAGVWNSCQFCSCPILVGTVLKPIVLGSKRGWQGC